jgi:hypothetical protein
MSWGRFKGKAKFGSTRTTCGLHSHRSKLEAAVCGLHQELVESGEYCDLVAEDSVYLTAARIQYIADLSFTVVATGERQWSEAKGFETSDWRIKRKLWTVYGPGKLNVWKGTASRPYLHEEITPKGESA